MITPNPHRKNLVNLDGKTIIIIDDLYPVLDRLKEAFTELGAANVVCICTARPKEQQVIDERELFFFPDRKLGGELLGNYIKRTVRQQLRHLPRDTIILCNDVLDPTFFGVSSPDNPYNPKDMRELTSHYYYPDTTYTANRSCTTEGAVLVSKFDLDCIRKHVEGHAAEEASRATETVKLYSGPSYQGYSGSMLDSQLRNGGTVRPFILSQDIYTGRSRDTDIRLIDLLDDPGKILEVIPIAIEQAKPQKRENRGGEGQFTEMVAGGSRSGFNIVAGY